MLLCSWHAWAGAGVETALRSAIHGAQQHQDLDQLYRDERYRLLWSANNRLTKQATVLLQALHEAEQFGLRPADYVSSTLADAERMVGADSTDNQSWAAFDVHLSAALLAFISDLHFGRVDPRAAGTELTVRRGRLDLPAAVVGLSRSTDVNGSLRNLEPQFYHYELLKRALGRYRALARDPTLTTLPPRIGRTVKPGEFYAGADRLQRLLIALGDMPAQSAAAHPVSLDPPLVEALKSFQARHGLDADGAMGPATWRNLTIPLSERVRQIEFTLERWRWLPPRLEGQSIFINIPQFTLFAFQGAEDRAAGMLTMNVVVGEAVEPKHTPVFVADMTHLIVRPYWDVPYSIATRELLPQIRRHPDYLETNHLEIVDRAGGPQPPTPSSLAAVATGALRLRQKPGADNALGLVKFMLPNPYNVYLHDTPARSLFARSRRAFSHGCIRLSDAAALAEYVLRDNPLWNRERLLQTMNGDETVRVNLPHPIRVFIVYGTVVARERGDVLFFDDLYGHDARLARLLARR